MSEPSYEAIEARLNEAFGARTVHSWPDIPRTRPRWWQREALRREARINAALATIGSRPVSERMRGLYWEQVRLGQDIYEDAGGYFLRCWWAAIGLPYTPHQQGYQETIDKLAVEIAMDVWLKARHIGLEPGDPSYEEMRPQMEQALRAALPFMRPAL